MTDTPITIEEADLVSGVRKRGTAMRRVAIVLQKRVALLENDLAEARESVAEWQGEWQERAERAEAKLAALLDVKPDVAGLVGRLRAVANDSGYYTEFTEAANALLSLAAQLAEARELSVPGSAKVFAAMEAQLAEKEAECEALRKDAERYRAIVNMNNGEFHMFVSDIHDMGIDAAIDSAREKP